MTKPLKIKSIKNYPPPLSLSLSKIRLTSHKDSVTQLSSQTSLRQQPSTRLTTDDINSPRERLLSSQIERTTSRVHSHKI